MSVSVYFLFDTFSFCVSFLVIDFLLKTQILSQAAGPVLAHGVPQNRPKFAQGSLTAKVLSTQVHNTPPHLDYVVPNINKSTLMSMIY